MYQESVEQLFHKGPNNQVLCITYTVKLQEDHLDLYGSVDNPGFYMDDDKNEAQEFTTPRCSDPNAIHSHGLCRDWRHGDRIPGHW